MLGSKKDGGILGLGDRRGSGDRRGTVAAKAQGGKEKGGKGRRGSNALGNVFDAETNKKAGDLGGNITFKK